MQCKEKKRGKLVYQGEGYSMSKDPVERQIKRDKARCLAWRDQSCFLEQ